MKRKIVWESQRIDIEEDEDDDVGYDEEESLFGKPGRAISTPLGIYDVDDKFSNPYRQFDLWMGHTNFSLTPETVQKIEETPGVEVLKVISQYRFLVAPGKLFNWKDVGLLIQKRIGGNRYEEVIAKLDESIKKEVGTALETLKGEDFWRLYVFPNGEIHYKSYGGLLDYETGKQEFTELKKASNGIIITSD